MKEINDGGPAFPTTPVSHGYTPDTQGNGTGCGPGMSMRDYFAGQALSGLSSAVTRSDAVRWSWEMADAMIAARNQPTE